MDIVDCQLHLGPGGIEQAIAGMDAVGVKAALIDEYWMGHAGHMPSHPIVEGTMLRVTAPVAELAAMLHPDRFSYLLRVDRRDPEMASILRLLRDQPGARALRLIPGLSQPELSALADGGYDALIAAALDNGISVAFATMFGNAEALDHVAAQFPAMRFVICHTGMPMPMSDRSSYRALGFTDPLPDMGDTSDEAGKAAAFGRVLRMADRHPNIGLKWAHAQRMFGVTGYPFDELRPWLRRAADAFGAERMMWASDVTANRTGESWAELLFWLIHNPDLSTSERIDLLGGTARRWLEWPAA